MLYRDYSICVLKNDMDEILKMFQKADVLVLATPVYFYGISVVIDTRVNSNVYIGDSKYDSKCAENEGG